MSLVQGQTGGTWDYYPTLGGSSYDPVSNGGSMTSATVYAADNSTVLLSSTSVARVSPGFYRFTFTGVAPAAGQYPITTVWVPSTGGQTVTDTNDKIVCNAFGGGSAVTSLAQVTDVRASANDVTTSPLAYLFRSLTDAQLLTLLTRASRRVEAITGARLMPFTVTEEVDVAFDAGNYQPFARRALVSHTPPARQELWIGSVVSVSLLDPFLSPIGTIPQATVVNFDTRQGVARFDATAAQFSGRALVTYSGGYSPVPEDLVEATVLLAADAFIVGVDARDGQNDAADLYNRAMSILNPWMRSGADSLGIA